MGLSEKTALRLWAGVAAIEDHPAEVVKFAQAVEAEVRKDDDALIRQMLEALEYHTVQTRPIEKTNKVMAAARAHLLDSDLSKLTERGAKAWAGVDPQKLREGGAL